MNANFAWASTEAHKLCVCVCVCKVAYLSARSNGCRWLSNERRYNGSRFALPESKKVIDGDALSGIDLSVWVTSVGFCALYSAQASS